MKEIEELKKENSILKEEIEKMRTLVFTLDRDFNILIGGCSEETDDAIVKKMDNVYKNKHYEKMNKLMNEAKERIKKQE